MNHLIRIALFAMVACSLVLASSCSKDKALQPVPPTLCDTVSPSFANEIHPIFIANCAVGGCHTQADQANGFQYETYQGVINVVNLGDRLVNAINHRPGVTPMPFGGPQLPDSLIKKIECWIANGALNN